ncbi:PepSY-like domain-containing protein [Planctomycetota bacterium]
MKCRNWRSIAVSILLCGILSAVAAEEEKKITVPPSELPAIIKKAIKDALPKGQVVRIQKEVEGEDPGQYDVDMRSSGKEYEVEIFPEGEVIEIKEVGIVSKIAGDEQERKWTESFNQENCVFSSIGKNRFFILEPGYQLVLESDEEKVVITVLGETKKIGRVRTRVIEEREEKNGRLAEVSRNFFAICKEHGDVFYFGEEVDDYKDGKIVAHSGAWRADELNSKSGIIMPGTILLGARHYQEIAPNAMDRAEIISDDITMETPAGTFKNCIRVEETSGLDPDEKCYKTYAPGVGLIQDEDLVLTGFGWVKELSISLRDVPRPVRATIRKHAAGGKIIEIEKNMTSGTIVYEAEIARNNKAFDILVSSEGKFLGIEEEEVEGDENTENDKEGDDG